MKHLDEYLTEHNKTEKEQVADFVKTFKSTIEEALKYMNDKEIIVYGKNKEEIKTKVGDWGEAVHRITFIHPIPIIYQYKNEEFELQEIYRTEKKLFIKKKYFTGYEIKKMNITTNAQFGEIINQRNHLQRIYSAIYKCPESVTLENTENAVKTLHETRKKFDAALNGPSEYPI